MVTTKPLGILAEDAQSFGIPLAWSWDRGEVAPRESLAPRPAEVDVLEEHHSLGGIPTAAHHVDAEDARRVGHVVEQQEAAAVAGPARDLARGVPGLDDRVGSEGGHAYVAHWAPDDLGAGDPRIARE
jgi:hypothetical protein